MIDWPTEFPKIQAIARDYGVDPFFIAAIRSAENGGPGREFGVLSVAAPTYEAQCHTACASVRNHLATSPANPLVVMQGPKVKRLVYSLTWIRAFAKGWAPPDVANDPEGLNQNWIWNASRAYARFVVADAVA